MISIKLKIKKYLTSTGNAGNVHQNGQKKILWNDFDGLNTNESYHMFSVILPLERENSDGKYSTTVKGHLVNLPLLHIVLAPPAPAFSRATTERGMTSQRLLEVELRCLSLQRKAAADGELSSRL